LHGPCFFSTIISIFVRYEKSMGTKEKLIERFLSLPKDFTYVEVKRLFAIFGYVENTKGNTSGSRVEFVSGDGLSSYIMHRPHPSNVIKSYAMKQILSFVHAQKLIEKYVDSKNR
jgi:hypothetical protein